MFAKYLVNFVRVNTCGGPLFQRERQEGDQTPKLKSPAIPTGGKGG